MLRRITKNFAAQCLGLLVSFADRFLVVGILLRMWGVQVYADWALLLSFVGLLSLAEFGLNIYYGNVLQRTYAENDVDGFQRMVSVALACSLTVGGLLAATLLVVVIILVDLPGLLSISIMSRGDATAGICLLGAAAISRLVRGAVSPIYRGRQAFARGIVMDLIFLSSLAVLSAAAGLMGASPIKLAGLYLACDLLTGWGFTVADLRRHWPALRLRPQFPKRTELQQMWLATRWLAILHGTSIAWMQLPVILLGYFGATGSALVSFLVLRTIANLARQFASILAMSAGVEIAGVQYSGGRDDVARYLGTVGRILALIAAALAVAVALFGEPFIALWTGQAALFDKSIAAALFAGLLISAPALPLLMFGIFGSTPKPVAMASVAQLGIALPACVLLTAWYGAPGAALGLLFGEAVGLGIVLPSLASQQIRLNYLSYFGQCICIMVLVALWCGAVGFVLRLLLDPQDIVGLLVSGAVWGLVGFAPALAAVLPASQRSSIIQWFFWKFSAGAMANSQKS